MLLLGINRLESSGELKMEAEGIDPARKINHVLDHFSQGMTEIIGWIRCGFSGGIHGVLGFWCWY